MSLWTTKAGPLPQELRTALEAAGERLAKMTPEQIAAERERAEQDPAFRRLIRSFNPRRPRRRDDRIYY